ncbi:hypothetical protein FGG08_000851 [Glutinoglossum americanum]|uniref:Uncharacterized protein n=1 Tax=Glutinoglossum americanum TaxID=1670608 RepID=A0A9P8IC88_9PEZI|nr:hypothetical protein FGG08_000851 [Glutinoglossum americanum]
MSLQSIYTKFLAAPSAAALADDSATSLHYIPTLTTIHEAQPIVKHLRAQVPQLKKREENVLSATESDTGLVLEVETTLELLTSGGAYLPGLDDNFLADKVLTFPIIHIVQFNENRQIQQIRLHWDQASLLKQVDVIGTRAKNWPIRDGKDQIRLISSSTSLVGKSLSSSTSSTAAGRVVPSKGHSTNGSTTNHPTRDPHASLTLFAPRDLNEDAPRPAAVAPRASAKPPARDYHDLFVGNESDASPATVSKGRSFAGGKPSEEIIAPKMGAGKNFQPSRLFDNEETIPTPQQSPERTSRKPNPKKYNHFDFGDGSEEGNLTHATAAPPAKPRSKHASQWDFEDFVTPEKVTAKVRGQQVRHFGWSDDEVNEESPVKHKTVAAPRRDAETHFEFQDDGTPSGTRRPAGHPRGTAHNTGLGLYQNNLYGDAEPKPSQQQNQPLGNVTNINHRKNFDSQFSMTDDSPASKDQKKEKSTGGDHKAAVRMMDSNWDAYDQSPQVIKKENTENKPSKTGIKTTGDGMGAKKGAGRQWGFGDDSDGEENGGVNGRGFRKGVPSRKQQEPATGNTFWDF